MALPVFFFNDTATTEIYTLSLHDALPILFRSYYAHPLPQAEITSIAGLNGIENRFYGKLSGRSEEHTSELQSQSNLVCRLLLEKKKHLIQHATRRIYPCSQKARASRSRDS